MIPMSGQLEGIKVLDFTQAMAGPMATMLLGDLGADVIKVEPPTGDQTRKWAPPYSGGMSSYFLSANRNKRSFTINLKEPGSKEIILKVLKSADVLIENFRPGTMKSFGLDYDSVKGTNDKIIYCSLSGYGQTGPYRNKPGYDLTILANSGLMGINGEPGRSPVKFGVPIADITSGLFADIAILSALYNRELTGEGQYIDMAMLDANVLTLTNQAFNFFSTGKDPQRMGSVHSNIAPYQIYRASDGYIAVAVGTEKLWKIFCKVIEREDLAEDERFYTNQERLRNRDLLTAELENTFMKHTKSDLQEMLEGAGIPAASIKTMSEVASDEQVRERDMITKMNAPYGEIDMLGTPFRFLRNSGSLRLPPPMMGEHTHDVLKESGFSEKEIEEMLKKGQIKATQGKDSEIFRK